MRLSEIITKAIDALYIRPVAAIVPSQLFRYGACGVSNMILDSVWYFLLYHFVICKRYIDLGFVVVSPHIAALVLVFPITFFTGFWLNRNVAFRHSPVATHAQLARYALTVAGAILLNYVCMKVLVETCGIWATPSKLITTVISAVYSFLAAKYFTFRNAEK